MAGDHSQGFGPAAAGDLRSTTGRVAGLVAVFTSGLGGAVPSFSLLTTTCAGPAAAVGDTAAVVKVPLAARPFQRATTRSCVRSSACCARCASTAAALAGDSGALAALAAGAAAAATVPDAAAAGGAEVLTAGALAALLAAPAADALLGVAAALAEVAGAPAPPGPGVLAAMSVLRGAVLPRPAPPTLPSAPPGMPGVPEGPRFTAPPGVLAAITSPLVWPPAVTIPGNAVCATPWLASWRSPQPASSTAGSRSRAAFTALLPSTAGGRGGAIARTTRSDGPWPSSRPPCRAAWRCRRPGCRACRGRCGPVPPRCRRWRLLRAGSSPTAAGNA